MVDFVLFDNEIDLIDLQANVVRNQDDISMMIVVMVLLNEILQNKYENEFFVGIREEFKNYFDKLL